MACGESFNLWQLGFILQLQENGGKKTKATIFTNQILFYFLEMEHGKTNNWKSRSEKLDIDKKTNENWEWVF